MVYEFQFRISISLLLKSHYNYLMFSKSEVHILISNLICVNLQLGQAGAVFPRCLATTDALDDGDNGLNKGLDGSAWRPVSSITRNGSTSTTDEGGRAIEKDGCVMQARHTKLLQKRHTKCQGQLVHPPQRNISQTTSSQFKPVKSVDRHAQVPFYP